MESKHSKDTTMKIKIWIALILFCVILFLPASSQEENQSPVILDDLIKAALENNPRIDAAIQRIQAAERAVPQAGALPDPKLTLGLMNLPVNSFAFDQEPMTGKMISVMQMFPFPGKQSLATDMAEFEVKVRKYQRDEIRNQVVQMVKQGYYELYGVDRAIETVKKNRSLMKQLVQVVETKYATGSGLQQDVLRAQVELSKIEDDLVMWEQKRLAIEARLNAVLNRPAELRFGVTPRELSIPEIQDHDFSLDRIEKTRPLLSAWQEKIRKAEVSVSLAQKDLWPNFTLGTSYSQRNNLQNGAVMHDFFSISFSLDIPIFAGRKQKAQIAQRQLDLKALDSEYKDVESGVLAEIAGLRAELERHSKRIALYEGGILLQARQSLESAQVGYQVGKVDFLTLISNWMMLQNYELQFAFAVAEYHKILARIELATGRGIAGRSEGWAGLAAYPEK